MLEIPRAPLVTPGMQDYREEIHDVPDEQVHQADAVEEAPEHVEPPAEQVPPAQTVPEVPSPVKEPRPRRNAKPNPKYSPKMYDLSYVGAKPRLRSRRSIRRAGK